MLTNLAATLPEDALAHSVPPPTPEKPTTITEKGPATPAKDFAPATDTRADPAIDRSTEPSPVERSPARCGAAGPASKSKVEFAMPIWTRLQVTT